MSSLALLYLADIIPVIQVIAAVFLVIGGFLLTFLLLNTDDCFKKTPIAEKIRKSLKSFLCIWILSVLIVIFLPSQKFMYILAGVHLSKEVADNEKVSNIINKSYQALNKKLDELLQEEKGGRK